MGLITGMRMTINSVVSYYKTDSHSINMDYRTKSHNNLMIVMKKGITDRAGRTGHWVNTDVTHHRLAVSIIARVTLAAGIIMDVIT